MAIDQQDHPASIVDLVPYHEPFPMLARQQACWSGQSGAFELGGIAAKFYVEVKGHDLRIDALTLAWQSLIDRHPALRMVVLADGQQQILEKPPVWQMEVLDLRSVPHVMQKERLGQIRHDMLGLVQPGHWPLFSLRMTRVDENISHLHFCCSRIALDPAQIAILLGELSARYRHPDATFAAVSTADFRDNVLSLQQLSDDEHEAQRYWLDRLPGFFPAPDLPFNRPPSTIVNPKFIRYRQGLSPDQWASVQRVATEKNICLDVLLLAAFGAVLGRWSRRRQFAIGIFGFDLLPMQNDRVLGPWESVSLLEIDLSVPETFLAYVRKVQTRFEGDMTHRLRDGFEVMRTLSQSQQGGSSGAVPVVFSNLIGQRFDAAFKSFGDIVSSVTQSAQVWMDLQLDENAGGLLAKWDVVESLFPEGTVRDMLDSYCALLARLGSDESVWQYNAYVFLPRYQLDKRIEINATDTPFAEASLLNRLFAKKAALLGVHKVAVHSSRRTLTYAELLSLSHQIGRQLQALGCQPNRLVGIVMHKGWEQIPAVLGVLQAGAAYLPIDPDFPEERIRFLVDHGQIKLVLTQSWLVEDLRYLTDVDILAIDSDMWADMDDTPLVLNQSPTDLAYVLYTSGSTGTPKGVMIEHRSVVNRILDINSRFSVGEQDRVIALTALQHDLSVYDIFGTLIAGATLVIPDADRLTDPAHLAQLMADAHVSVWNSVPAFLEMYVDYLEQMESVDRWVPNDLRFVILAGDWIPVTLPDRLKAIQPAVNLIASGGPTEDTIWDIFYPVGHVSPTWKSIPYGRPLANAHYYILDENLAPCPDWVVGEMYIGGAGLARGYWRDHEKTAQQFITHPETGERLYRSGDLGRFLPDGQIEFVGRVDFQVKLRGYRIELGEIEAALLRHDDIKSAVVALVDSPGSGKRLVAYVVENIAADRSVPEGIVQRDEVDGSSAGIDIAHIRRFLRRSLPAYMVPAVFVILASLPLTVNGKVNRAALPEPVDAYERTGSYIAPDTVSEKMIAGIWQEITGIDAIGIQDNFFDLGGDSLAALQVIAQVEQKIAVRLNPRAMVSDTLEQIAQACETAVATDRPEKDRVLKRLGRYFSKKIRIRLWD